MLQGNAVAAQGVLIRLLQIGFATGSLVSLGILLLQVQILLLLSNQVDVCTIASPVSVPAMSLSSGM